MPAQDQVRLLVDLQIDAVRQQELDRVRIAEREGRDLALDVGAIADADNIQLARESGGDTLDGVRGQRARQPVQRRVLVAVALTLERAVRSARRGCPAESAPSACPSGPSPAIASPILIFTPSAAGSAFFQLST